MPDLLLWTGKHDQPRRHAHHLRLDPDGDHVRRLCPGCCGTPLWAGTCTPSGRRRGRAPGRRAGGPRSALSVYVVCGLLCAGRGSDVDRPDARVAAGRRVGQPGLDHCRRHRRHQPVRRRRPVSSAPCSARRSSACCSNGLTLAGVDVLWQDFAVGILIIAAVADRPVDPQGESMTTSPVNYPRGPRPGQALRARDRRSPGSDFDLQPGRDPGRDRRQRRRQVVTDQVPPRAPSCPTRARSCSTASRSRCCTPASTPARSGIETVYQTLAVSPSARHRRQPVPRPRTARARYPRHRSSARPTAPGCAPRHKQADDRARG